MKLNDIMVKEVVCAELPGNRTDIIKLMVRENKTGMPILMGDGSMAGFITRQDIYANPEEEQLAILMSKDFPFLGPNDSIEEGARILLDNNIHHLPVIKRKKLVGIVTPADYLNVIEKQDNSEPIENFVRTPCAPIYEGAPISVADTLFRVANVMAAPVLNDEGCLSGIVTDRDIFKHSNVDAHTAVADLGIGEDEDSWTWEGLRNVIKLYYEVKHLTLPKIKVKEVMVSEPITIFRKTGVTEAARIMNKHDFGQLPIRDSQDKLVAMIYELDLLATILR